MQERLQKIIARAGIASRRHAEQLILSGQVRVNGHVVTELGTKADAAQDRTRNLARRRGRLHQSSIPCCCLVFLLKTGNQGFQPFNMVFRPGLRPRLLTPSSPLAFPVPE